MKPNVRKMVLSSLFASLMAVCAWICIPIPPVTFTLQTFGVLLALGILGGRWGMVSVLLYLAMGIAGLPVFSGFQGGVSVLLGPTGGFLWGFLLGSVVYRLTERLGKPVSLLLCQLTCYLCGCLWFCHWAGCGMMTAALTCVIPYLVFDGLKLWLAWHLSRRIGKHLKN